MLAIMHSAKAYSAVTLRTMGKTYTKVSMGLTVSRKTGKTLTVRRKNERILTISRKKMLTVKKPNHKIRSRDLLLSLMCYAFMCSGS